MQTSNLQHDFSHGAAAADAALPFHALHPWLARGFDWLLGLTLFALAGAAVGRAASVIHISTPRVIEVPQNYPTLQAAIDGANAGDKIVNHGPFNGDVDLKGKKLTIIITGANQFGSTATTTTLSSNGVSLSTETQGQVNVVDQNDAPQRGNGTYRTYTRHGVYTSDPDLGPVYKPFDYRSYHFIDGQAIEDAPVGYSNYVYYPRGGDYGFYLQGEPYDSYNYGGGGNGGFYRAPIDAQTSSGYYNGGGGRYNGGGGRNRGGGGRGGYTPGQFIPGGGGPTAPRGPSGGFGGTATGGFNPGGFRLGMGR